MDTECTKSEIGKHCWHAGVGMGMCCWCGQIRSEEVDVNAPHGPNKWLFQPQDWYQFRDTWTTGTATAGQFGSTPYEPCMIEEFFKQNPGATTCLYACSCPRHRVICTY